MNVEAVKTRILIVDDHLMVRQGIRQLLESEDDFEVIGEAGDGDQAVQMAADLHPDVIIMDLMMPKLDGIEAARQIKAATPGTAIILLTGFDYGSYTLAVLKAGVAGFLPKKLGGAELIAAVKAIRLGHTVIDGGVTLQMLQQLSGVNSTDGISDREILQPREIDVIRLVAKGMNNKAIAEVLGISERATQTHLSNIFSKLNTTSRTEAVTQALKLGVISLCDIP